MGTFVEGSDGFSVGYDVGDSDGYIVGLMVGSLDGDSVVGYGIDAVS